MVTTKSLPIAGATERLTGFGCEHAAEYQMRECIAEKQRVRVRTSPCWPCTRSAGIGAMSARFWLPVSDFSNTLVIWQRKCVSTVNASPTRHTLKLGSSAASETLTAFENCESCVSSSKVGNFLEHELK